jgi:hypothetical protein
MSFVFSNNLSYQGGQYGNAILSKYPVLARDHKLLPKRGDNEQRGWLKTLVNLRGKYISLWVTHLATSDETERLMCVTNFNEWAALEAFPVVFGGDFNATPSSGTYTRMTSKWQDAWPAAGFGNGWTIPVPTPTRRIDYIWTSKGSGLRPRTAYVPYTEASDHFPVLAEFILTNSPAEGRGFFFPFDEGSGTNLLDIVSGLSGALDMNRPLWNADSPTGAPGDRSLSFYGTNRVTVADPRQIVGPNSTNGDYTLQAWVRLPSNITPAARMILFQYERYPGFSLSINTDLTLHTTTFQVKDVKSDAAFPNDGKWHHVAVVHRDGIDLKFYVDAVLGDTVAYTNGPGFRTSPEITIGSASGGANSFTGSLDRVSFENVALSPDRFDFPALPPLRIKREGGELQVYWAARRMPFVLQSSTNLTSWTQRAAAQSGDKMTCNVQPSNSATWFRLTR